MSVHKVVYKGLSDVRRMSKKDLEGAGVGVGGDMVWDKSRMGPRPTLFVKDISDRLLEVLRAEGTFTVSEVDEATLRESGQEPVVDGQALDDTGGTVVDTTTGQKSESKKKK